MVGLRGHVVKMGPGRLENSGTGASSAGLAGPAEDEGPASPVELAVAAEKPICLE